MDGALYETLAGTGATLVAIIGGFAMAKWLQIANEITALDHDLSQVELRITMARNRMMLAEERVEEFEGRAYLDNDGFATEVLRAAAHVGPRRPPIDEPRHKAIDALADKRFPLKLDRSRSPWVQMAMGDWIDTAQEVMNHPWFGSLPDSSWRVDWSAIRTAAPPGRVRERLWRLHYDSLRPALRDAWLESAPHGMDEYEKALVGARVLNSPPDLYELPDSMPPRHSGHPPDSIESLRAESKVAWDGLGAILAEKDVIETRRRRYVKPEGVRVTLAVLFATFVATVAPSVAMLAGGQPASGAVRLSVVLGLYGLGVGAMFAFMSRIADGRR